MEKEARTQPEFLEQACIATRMLNKRRQLFDLKYEFDAQKIEHDRQYEILKEKGEVLSQRDLAFQQSLAKFEVLSMKHESKHERAAKRLEEEVKLCEIKDREATELKQFLEEERAREHRLRELVQAKKRYQDFLELCTDYSEPRLDRYAGELDILTRYELLKQTKARRKERLEWLNAEIMSNREELEGVVVKETRV